MTFDPYLNGSSASPEAGPSTYAYSRQSPSSRLNGECTPSTSGLPVLYPGMLSSVSDSSENGHYSRASPTYTNGSSPRRSPASPPSVNASPGLPHPLQPHYSTSIRPEPLSFLVSSPGDKHRKQEKGGSSVAEGGAYPRSGSPMKTAASGVEGMLGENKGMKRRPRPLDLRADGGNVRVDSELQEHLDDIASAATTISDHSSMSDDMQNLTVLRETVHRNLRDRPVVYSPLSGFATPSTPDSAPPDLEESDMTDASDLLHLLSSTSQLVIVDTRALGSYLDNHLPRSANLSIPTLILKRVKKGIGAKMTWNGMESFVTTPEGKEVWGGIDPESEGVRVVLLGSWGWDETARALLPVLKSMVPTGDVTIVRGGWEAVQGESSLAALVQGTKIAGPTSAKIQRRPTAPLRSATLPLLHQARQPTTAPTATPELSFLLAPPTPPADPVPRLANQISMPSLRSKRGQPTLSLQTGVHGNGKKTPGLTLDIDRPMRSATVGTFPRSPAALRSPGLLKIDTTLARESTPATSPRESKFPNNPMSIPPSPRANGKTTQIYHDEPDSIPRSPVMTSRHAMSPFIVSTILPGFLFLGPEITNDEDVAALRRMGVKRILNVAMECEDGAGMGLRETFERYLKIPMRDTVEESGVGKGMRDSCDFLDDARLHDAPTYVHCRAGKSRSVTVVLAYLIHANAWTLKTAYAYVAERRKGISPNIGFVAELMQFEEAELGVKQSGGVNGDSGSRADSTSNGGSHDGGEVANDSSGNGKSKGKSHHRYARESLPPAWGSLGALKPGWISSFSDSPGEGESGEVEMEKDQRKVDEREVRKNGQWVHQRRVPVDRSTLQPGRRASKAGLESLRSFATLSSSRPSPHPDPSTEQKPATPGAEGRLGWI